MFEVLEAGRGVIKGRDEEVKMAPGGLQEIGGRESELGEDFVGDGFGEELDGEGATAEAAQGFVRSDGINEILDAGEVADDEVSDGTGKDGDVAIGLAKGVINLLKDLKREVQRGKTGGEGGRGFEVMVKGDVGLIFVGGGRDEGGILFQQGLKRLNQQCRFRGTEVLNDQPCLIGELRPQLSVAGWAHLYGIGGEERREVGVKGSEGKVCGGALRGRRGESCEDADERI